MPHKEIFSPSVYRRGNARYSSTFHMVSHETGLSTADFIHMYNTLQPWFERHRPLLRRIWYLLEAHSRSKILLHLLFRRLRAGYPANLLQDVRVLLCYSVSGGRVQEHRHQHYGARPRWVEKPWGRHHLQVQTSVISLRFRIYFPELLLLL